MANISKFGSTVPLSCVLFGQKREKTGTVVHRYSAFFLDPRDSYPTFGHKYRHIPPSTTCMQKYDKVIIGVSRCAGILHAIKKQR